MVLSSRFIPGNERTINTLVNQLYKRGAEVFYESVAPVHVSGHANQDELAELIALTRPKYFVPIHGEYRHLRRHVALAAASGIPEAHCFLLEDGEPLTLSAGPTASRARAVEAGRILLEDGEFGDPGLLSERRTLGRDGTVFAVVAVSSKTGAIVAGPELTSRGLLIGDGASAHIRRASAQLAERLNRVAGPFSAEGTMLACRRSCIRCATTSATRSASGRLSCRTSWRSERHRASAQSADRARTGGRGGGNSARGAGSKPRRARTHGISAARTGRLRRAEPGLGRGRPESQPVRHPGRRGRRDGRRSFRVPGLSAGDHGGVARDTSMERRSGAHAGAREFRRRSSAGCAQRRRGTVCRRRAIGGGRGGRRNWRRARGHARQLPKRGRRLSASCSR